MLAGWHQRLGNVSRVPSGHRAPTLVVQAASAASSTSHTRVLRYPDGSSRRITYPSPPIAIDDSLDIVDTWDEDDSWQQAHDAEECALSGASCNQAYMKTAGAETNVGVLIQYEELNTGLSFEEELAAALSINSSESERVHSSYTVLRGSPWLRPKPLHVLATSSGLMHTMPVRCERTDVQDELARVLKEPSLGSAIAYAEMKDGVVSFELAEDAASYATCLEAEMDREVAVMRVDSKHLFLNTGDVGALVVYVKASGRGGFVPMPHQLAHALRTEDSTHRQDDGAWSL